jgi:hypothetical protein
MQAAAFYKEGFIVKCGNSYKSWKRRWFVLRVTENSATFCYFRMRGVCLHHQPTTITSQHSGLTSCYRCCCWQDSLPAGVIDMKTAIVRPNLRIQKQNAFEIMTPMRVYDMCTDTPEQRQQWMERLQAVTDYATSNANIKTVVVIED